MTDQKDPRRFSVKDVHISRGYSANTPFTASISAENNWGNEIKIKLPEERVQALIEHVQDIIVETLQEQFTNMREDHLAAIEEKRLKELPPAVETTSTPADG